LEHQLPLSSVQRADYGKVAPDGTHEVLDDLAYRRLAIVNVLFSGLPGARDREWVLIDAGVIGSTRFILRSAEKRFGKDSRPSAIIMTHGHFDHVGGLEELAARWDCPVYAHPAELPYLSGESSYASPDPSVGGGLMSLLSPLYPRGPVDVGDHLRPLPSDGSVPGMIGWEWIHTPGHSPGHIALWNKNEKTVISGDAFITTRQESAYAVAIQAPEMHGPPMYFTQNWEEARESVQTLAALEPQIVVTGHGMAMKGEEVRRALHTLANNFDEIARPETGKYVEHPLTGQEWYVNGKGHNGSSHAGL